MTVSRLAVLDRHAQGITLSVFDTCEAARGIVPLLTLGGLGLALRKAMRKARGVRETEVPEQISITALSWETEQPHQTLLYNPSHCVSKPLFQSDLAQRTSLPPASTRTEITTEKEDVRG